MNQIIIANQNVTLDEYGRISLNTLHKLSGAGRSKEPGQWLRLASTQELITVLEQDADLHHGQKIIARRGNAKHLRPRAPCRQLCRLDQPTLSATGQPSLFRQQTSTDNNGAYPYQQR